MKILWYISRYMSSLMEEPQHCPNVILARTPYKLGIDGELLVYTTLIIVALPVTVKQSILVSCRRDRGIIIDALTVQNQHITRIVTYEQWVLYVSVMILYKMHLASLALRILTLMVEIMIEMLLNVNWDVVLDKCHLYIQQPRKFRFFYAFIISDNCGLYNFILCWRDNYYVLEENSDLILPPNYMIYR